MPNTQEAYERSVSLLEKLQTERGFVASLENVANYRRVWSRDGTVAGLAGMLTGSPALIKSYHTTLLTLIQHQDDTGRIPSNVGVQNGTVSYGTTVGRIDATLWFVIGAVEYCKRHDSEGEVRESFREPLEKAMRYLEALELNGRGLLYIPIGGDWADEYINAGYVLFDELLYLRALDEVYELYADSRLKKKATHLRELIRVNYFPDRANIGSPFVYSESHFKKTLEYYTGPFPIVSLTEHNVPNHVDIFSVALLLMSGVLSEDEKNTIADEIDRRFPVERYPVLPAFVPTITEHDNAWEELHANYLFEFRNHPNEYHNGGLWPLVTGFYSCAVGNRGKIRLEAFSDILARDGYVFPEFYHGITHEPAGTGSLGFTASSYIIGYETVLHNKFLFV